MKTKKMMKVAVMKLCWKSQRPRQVHYTQMVVGDVALSGLHMLEADRSLLSW